MNSSKKWLLFIFVLPSVLCFTFYIFFIRNPVINSGKPIFKRLNTYGKKHFDGKDTIYATCKFPNAVTQIGEKIDGAFYNSNICVYSFVNYHDMLTTPNVLAQLYAALDKTKHLKSFAYVCVNINPNKNSVQEMFVLANKVHAPKHKWLFISFESNDIKKLLQENFLLYDEKAENNNSNSFVNEIAHTMFLVDKDQHIRGIYDATYVEDVKRMTSEAIVLEAEYRHKKKLGV
jgi:protein SCO1/2